MTHTATNNSAMKYLKDNPAGIDISIQSHQNFFYPAMLKVFGITDDTAFDLYGRAHNNQKGGGSVPEVLIGSNYTDVLFNDRKAVGQGFYAAGSKVGYSAGSGQASVALILQYTMTGITNGKYTPMHDEQVNQAVMNICRYPKFGFTFTGLVKQVNNIFKEYPQWKDSVKFSDIYPWHVLRLEFDLIYNISGNYNCQF